MAEKPNPFGNIIPLPGRFQPLGEGGGGLAPVRVTPPAQLPPEAQAMQVRPQQVQTRTRGVSATGPVAPEARMVQAAKRAAAENKVVDVKPKIQERRGQGAAQQAEQMRRTQAEQMAAEHNKLVERKRAAEDWIKARGKPRAVDEEFRMEQELRLIDPRVNNDGYVQYYVPTNGSFMMTNPVNNRTVVLVKGGEWKTFQTRVEALKFLTEGPK